MLLPLLLLSLLSWVNTSPLQPYENLRHLFIRPGPLPDDAQGLLPLRVEPSGPIMSTSDPPMTTAPIAESMNTTATTMTNTTPTDVRLKRAKRSIEDNKVSAAWQMQIPSHTSLVDDVSRDEKVRREKMELDSFLMHGIDEIDTLKRKAVYRQYTQYNTTNCTYDRWFELITSKSLFDVYRECGKPQEPKRVFLTFTEHQPSTYSFAWAARYTCPSRQRYDLEWTAELVEEHHPLPENLPSGDHLPINYCNCFFRVIDFNLKRNGEVIEHPGWNPVQSTTFCKVHNRSKYNEFHSAGDRADVFTSPAFSFGDLPSGQFIGLHDTMYEIMDLMSLKRSTSRCDDIKKDEFANILCASRESGDGTFMYNRTFSPFQKDASIRLDLESTVRRLLNVNDTENPCPDDEEVEKGRFERQVVELLLDYDMPSVHTVKKALSISWKEKFLNRSGVTKRAYARTDIHMRKLDTAFHYQHFGPKEVAIMKKRRLADCEMRDNKAYNDFLEKNFFIKLFTFWRRWTWYVDCEKKIKEEDDYEYKYHKDEEDKRR